MTKEEILAEINKNNLAAEIKNVIIEQESGVRSQESTEKYKFAVVDFNKNLFGITSLELAAKYWDEFVNAKKEVLQKYFQSQYLFFVHYQYVKGSTPYAFYVDGSELGSDTFISSIAPWGITTGYGRYGVRFQPFLYITK